MAWRTERLRPERSRHGKGKRGGRVVRASPPGRSRPSRVGY